MASLRDFMKLSELLTGLELLDPAIADDYRRQLDAASGLNLRELIAVYREVLVDESEEKTLAALLARFGGDPRGQRLHVTAQQVVRIWYLSELVDANGALSVAGHYLDSGLPEVYEAHPQGFSRGRYGDWAQRPRHRRSGP